MSVNELFSDDDEDPVYIDNMFVQKTAELEILSEASTSSSDTVSKLLAALAFNDLTDDKLGRLEVILKRRLQECRESLSQLIIHNIQNDPKDEKFFKYYYCGMPYFKDRSGWPPPDNFMTKMMKESQMIDHYKDCTSLWSARNKRDLINVIKIISRDIMKNKLKQRMCKNQQRKMTSKRFEEFKYQCSKIDKMDLKEVALPIDEDYDWEEIAQLLNHSHSAKEISAMWKLCLHPSINKSRWTKLEQFRLQAIVIKHKEQNWEQIALDLNTGRTIYQCFIHYMRYIVNKCNNKLWTKDEDTYLKRIMKLCNDDQGTPCGQVAKCLENRRPSEIYNRWKKSKRTLGRFLPEEDNVILTCVSEFGENFKLMSNYIQRSELQLKKRYQILKQYSWNKEETKQLKKLLNNENTCDFDIIRLYFPSKSLHDIKRKCENISYYNHCITEPACSLTESLEKLNGTLKNQIEKEITKVVLTEMDKSIMKFIIWEEIEKTPEDLNKINPINLSSKNIQVYQILLRAFLNKSDLEKTEYLKYYIKDEVPSVIGPNQIRSYSRKQNIDEASSSKNLTFTPNVWGQKLCTGSNFILPPSYNTLIGCRILSNFFQNEGSNCRTTLSILSRKNPVIEEHCKMLQERFRLLFFWPLRLSNTPHIDIKTYKPSPNIY